MAARGGFEPRAAMLDDTARPGRAASKAACPLLIEERESSCPENKVA